MKTDHMEEGRKAHELALAMLLVSELEDKFNGLEEPPPPPVPPPWRQQPRWDRRSAFRGKRRR